MGYTITVPVASKKRLVKMQAFMDQHYRDFGQVVKSKDFASASRPKSGDFAYDQGKQRIGFDYSPSWGVREYVTMVTHWMALRVGRRKVLPVFTDDGLKAKVPYYVYDGYEAIPIRPYSEWADKVPDTDEPCDWTFVDEDGWDLSEFLRKHRVMEASLGLPDYEQPVRAELARLSRLWEETVDGRGESLVDKKGV